LAAPLEQADETRFVQYAAALGCYAYKLEIPGIRGAPDRMVLCPDGRVLFMELKREKGAKGVSYQQKRFHTILTRLGFSVITVFGFEQAKAALNDFLHVPALPEKS